MAVIVAFGIIVLARLQISIFASGARSGGVSARIRSISFLRSAIENFWNFLIGAIVVWFRGQLSLRKAV